MSEIATGGGTDVKLAAMASELRVGVGMAAQIDKLAAMDTASDTAKLVTFSRRVQLRRSESEEWLWLDGERSRIMNCTRQARKPVAANVKRHVGSDGPGLGTEGQDGSLCARPGGEPA